MASIIRPRFFRGGMILSLAAAMAMIACYGILLLIESFSRNGSAEGSSLLFILSLVLIIPSTAAFTFLILYWKLSRPKTIQKNG
jgi:hypothetical protein